MIHYHTSTRIWLSLEDYYNRGITPEQAKETIESIHDTCSRYLSVDSSGCNGNWIVDTCRKHPADIADIVEQIAWALDCLLPTRGSHDTRRNQVHCRQEDRANSGPC